MRQRRSLLHTVGSISSATLVSRIFGLIRDQVQSFYFGAGFVTDAFIAAFRIPNLLRDLFAEGALSSAFVPTFTSVHEREGAAAAWRLANRVITLLALLLGAVALSIVLAAPAVLELYVAGFGPAKTQLATRMTRIVAPFLPVVALAAVAMGMLNVRGRFFLPALAPAAFNVASIACVVGLVPLLAARGVEPGLSLAIGAMAGGGLQLVVQLPALYREGFRLRPELAPRDPGVRRIGRLMLPATLGLAAAQLSIFVDTILASGFGNGPITWLQLAFRLMQLPLGLFGVAIGVANLTRVSRDAARGDQRALRGTLAASLRAAALLALPATAGLIALREPIVRVLFERGRFEPADTLQTAAALLCYALGLYAYSVTKIQVPTFYALDESRTPVLATAIAVTLKIGANFLFIAAFPRLGLDPFLGLAVSTSLAAWLNFGMLALVLRRRLGALRGERVVRTTLALVVVSVAVGLAAGGSHAAAGALVSGSGLAAQLVCLAAGIGAGLAALAACLPWLGIPETRALLAAVRRRLGRAD